MAGILKINVYNISTAQGVFECTEHFKSNYKIKFFSNSKDKKRNNLDVVSPRGRPVYTTRPHEDGRHGPDVYTCLLLQ